RADLVGCLPVRRPCLPHRLPLHRGNGCGGHGTDPPPNDRRSARGNLPNPDTQRPHERSPQAPEQDGEDDERDRDRGPVALEGEGDEGKGTTPPPSPVSDPRNPAMSAPSATSSVN